MTQQPTFSQPNYYEMTGQVQITYDPRDFDGVPRLTYQDPAAQESESRSYSFVGSDIHSQSSDLGTEVSVRLLPSPTIEITEVRLLLPTINMGDKDQQSFTTFAILTSTRGGGGSAVVGSQQSYQTLNLQGTAKIVKKMSSCGMSLEEYFTWAEQQNLKNGQCLLDCTVMSNQADGIVSFATGVLTYTPGRVLMDFREPSVFSGEFVQHIGYGQDASSQSTPFEPDQTSKIGISLSAHGGPVMIPASPSLTVNLPDENSGSFTIKPSCIANVVYGEGKAIGSHATNALYSISFANPRYVPNT